MKDPGDNRTILSSARNRVTAQRMQIKRMSIVRFKIRTLLRTYPLLVPLSVRAVGCQVKSSYWSSLTARPLASSARNERNVLLWRPNGWTIFGIRLRWEVFQLAVPSMDPKRDFKARWKFHWDSTRGGGNFLRDSKFYDQRSFTLSSLTPSYSRKKRNDSSANARFFSPFKVFRSAQKLEGGTWICNI